MNVNCRFWRYAKTGFTLAVIHCLSSVAYADIDLRKLIGYTIVDQKTIAGFVSENGEEKSGFEGCNFGRVIIFDDRRVLTCSEYNYLYSYRPTATLLSNGISWKMIVEDEIFEMRR